MFLARFSAQLVYWQTDSQACVRLLTAGSRQLTIWQLMFRIKQRERDLHIRIIPVWTPRNHPRIIAADTGSRLSVSTDEWFVDRSSLALVLRRFSFALGPDCVDCFASAANAVSPTFYSLVPQTGTSGVNFSAQAPTQPRLFMCPPVALIPQAVTRLLLLRGKQCVLLVPHWPAAVFWTLLHPAGRLHPNIHAQTIFRPICYSPTPCLFTATRLQFLALLIVT